VIEVSDTDGKFIAIVFPCDGQSLIPLKGTHHKRDRRKAKQN